MKSLRIKFIDGWRGWKMEDYFIYQVLKERYNLELTDKNPDYVVSVGVGFGDTDFKYPNAVKLVFIGENRTPDFNRFDYAIGFDHLQFGDRYLRFPLFATYPGYREILSRVSRPSAEALLDRKFCSFVVSNRHGDPLRHEFFERLSKYKRVDSGGRVSNNIGGRVSDKLTFCSQYKFNIAFENSVYPGYVTEKVIEALAANSVPIYYGDPEVACDVNPKAIVRLPSSDDVERVVEEVIRLDCDDAAYLEKCLAEPLVKTGDFYDKAIREFLFCIFDPPLESVRRLARFGSQANYREELKSFYCPKFPMSLFR